jgi:ATP-dependent helicase HrpB
VARYEQRKVVVATNVAETSLTIDGVRLVIDSGLARIARYDSNRGINTLLIEKISQANADQRAGRAGRTAPGVCMRLWSRDEHGIAPAQELPEIKRLDLAEVVLTLKAAGVEDLRKFRWLESPDEQSLTHAEELLHDLGALDKNNSITPIGRKMLAFPLHPRYARMLLAAQEFGCVYQACARGRAHAGARSAVAQLRQGRGFGARRFARRKGHVGFLDSHARVDVMPRKTSSALMPAASWASTPSRRGRSGRCWNNFSASPESEGLDTKPREVKDEALQKCIFIGFSDRVARRLDQGTLRCELVHNRRGVLARESVVQKSPLLVVAEIREIETRDK